MEFLNTEFYNNTLLQWIGALVTLLLLVLILRFLRDRTAVRLKRFADKTATSLDDLVVSMLSKTKLLVLFLVSMFAASQLLDLDPSIGTLIKSVAIVALLLQAAIWGNAVIGYVISHYIRLEVEEEATRIASTTALTFVGKLALWSVILLLALDNLGFDVTALVTGMGIGGLAIALAAQNILGDLFASLSILLDKPFVVGDFIIVGDLLGSVEKIGLKTTRVRSLHGEQLIFSNNDLLNSRIRNFKRMYERRILFGIGVVYQTPYELVAEIPSILKDVIEREELVRFDRAHFKEYGDSSLNFEIVYWVKSPDYNTYMDIQQRINLGIFQSFEKKGIEFAYPTRTLHIAEGLEKSSVTSAAS